MTKKSTEPDSRLGTAAVGDPDHPEVSHTDVATQSPTPPKKTAASKATESKAAKTGE